MVQGTKLYRAFGIDFQSVLALPEMREGCEGTKAPVTIARAPAPRPTGATEIERGVVAGPTVFWMEVAGVVRLLVTSGREIVVELLDEAREGDVRAYLLGSAMGALLYQRGLLPLHASAVEIDGRGFAFTGASGAGKSTMALHLNACGHRLICDDICAVDTSGDAPVVWPGLRNLKLWREALASAGHGHDGLEQVLPTLDKYRLPVAATADYRPYRLAMVLDLAGGGEGMPPVMEPLAGAEMASRLSANSFRGQLVKPMARTRDHFDQIAALARTVNVQRLRRPWQVDQLGRTCELIEQVSRT